MSTGLQINRELRTIFVTFEGVLSERELIDFQRGLLNHPEFDRRYHRLVDLRGLTRADVSMAVVSSVAHQARLDPPAKYAIVASKDVIFGLSRMYQSLSEGSLGGPCRVFRDMGEARRWLGLEAEESQRARPGGASGG